MLAVVAAVVLAFAWPEPGARGGVIGMGWLKTAGIMTIFLLQGLLLPTRELARGMGNVRLHGFVQAWIFVGVPVLVLLLGLVARGWFDPAVWNGFLYLAILPTTVSSAVVLSTAAGGDTSGALFNVTAANVAGVVAVPGWCMLLFAVSGGVPMDPLPLLVSLAQMIVLPLAVGQCLRPLLVGRRAFERAKPHFKTVNNAIIVYTIYTAFCGSVTGDTWAGFGAATLAAVIAMTALVLVLVSWLVWLSSGRLGLDRDSRISAFYCASQKTLAAGVPMATALFGGAQIAGDAGTAAGIDLGLLILPLMVYHPLQLLLGGAMVARFANANADSVWTGRG